MTSKVVNLRRDSNASSVVRSSAVPPSYEEALDMATSAQAPAAAEEKGSTAEEPPPTYLEAIR